MAQASPMAVVAALNQSQEKCFSLPCLKKQDIRKLYQQNKRKKMRFGPDTFLTPIYFSFTDIDPATAIVFVLALFVNIIGL